jgi:FKBP-type peptidyl-prolyl cis-trans isomerase FklB
MLRSSVALVLLLALLACSPEQASEQSNLNNKVREMNDVVDEGKNFLEANAQKDGVLVTASGLQYTILESGTGATPGLTDTVVTHYHGTFIDGKVFDSSVDRNSPLEFPVNGVISGWTEALQLMKEGDKWQLFIPPELAYGARGVGPIPGNTTLIFEVQLLEVK